MVEFRRSVGAPLDAASARDRARQISAVSDPARLRVLSAIAADPDAIASPSSIALALAMGIDEAREALEELIDVGLVSSGSGHSTLTADAWARFGRLIVSSTFTYSGEELGLPETDVSPSTVAVPPVVERIIDELSYRFSSSFSRETVARYVGESYSLLAGRARITRFLPSLTSRFAADRLSALATASGLVLRTTPEILFVCVQNAGRSQMAAAILRNLAGDRVHVRTAGSSPAAAVHPGVVDALDEIGVSLAADFPKPLTDEVVKAADYVITMGCGDACPVYPGRRYLEWELGDPAGMTMQEIRVVREDVYARVRSLLDEMNLSH